MEESASQIAHSKLEGTVVRGFVIPFILDISVRLLVIVFHSNGT